MTHSYCSVQCKNKQHLNHKQNCSIGFSILDTFVLDNNNISQTLLKTITNTCCKVGILGKLGLTHQYITSEALNYTENTWFRCNDYFQTIHQTFQCDSGISAKRLIIGILFNDAGMCCKVDYNINRILPLHTQDKLPYSGDNVVHCITNSEIQYMKNPPNYLHYVDERVRYYPCNWKDLILGMIGVKTGTNEAVILFSKADEFQHTHSMSMNHRYITLQEIIDKIVEQALEWFDKAINNQDMFFIGRILHMVQDSFSEAHTNRVCSSNIDNRPYSKFCVIEFYQYEKQDRKNHAKLDSIDRIMSDKCKDRLQVVVLCCANILYFYYKALIDYNVRERFKTYMIQCVYCTVK